jgi:hypothetical protein
VCEVCACVRCVCVCVVFAYVRWKKGCFVCVVCVVCCVCISISKLKGAAGCKLQPPGHPKTNAHKKGGHKEAVFLFMCKYVSPGHCVKQSLFPNIPLTNLAPP